MKFVKPEEFPICTGDPEKQRQWAAEYVNDKLEREGKVVYQEKDAAYWGYDETRGKTRMKALLIGIELIENRSNKASAIVRTVLQYFDVNPKSKDVLESCVNNVERQLSNKCEHPKAKVKHYDNPINNKLSHDYCECGSRVEPLTYGEVK